MTRTFAECFYAHNGRLVDKWFSYFDVYQKHFSPYVGKSVRVLEIGVSHGGSLQLWADYFGMGATITGIDIDERCLAYAEPPQIIVYQFDQNDPRIGQIGDFDIVIDDGSHVREHQEVSFRALWPRTRGIYLCEDCHGGYPQFLAPEAIRYDYPWVRVLERPKRVIRGNPSREMRQDEVDAFNLYSDV
jgi:hypothetical protein